LASSKRKGLYFCCRGEGGSVGGKRPRSGKGKEQTECRIRLLKVGVCEGGKGIVGGSPRTKKREEDREKIPFKTDISKQGEKKKQKKNIERGNWGQKKRLGTRSQIEKKRKQNQPSKQGL